ncbi:MAG: hypothetical protein E7618_02965 [Ruminococcaceae bacterium]|nr:hypothetical protein [Oscillospiraceae bacterium]
MGNKILYWISLVSGLITIGDIAIKSIKSMSLYISNIAIIFLVITIVLIVLAIVFSHFNARYGLNSRIKYLFTRKSFTVLEKECVYQYVNRTELKYTKTHKIKANTNDISSFSDKFKWSVEQKLDDISIRCFTCDSQMILKREENWHCYSINFDPMAKSSERKIQIQIDNLKDPDKKALPFLSSNIIHKTKKLVLKVVFSNDVTPINLKYKIFDNYSSDNPIYSEDYENKPKTSRMHYDVQTRTLSISEEYPVWGYKYLLSWDFEGEENSNTRFVN